MIALITNTRTKEVRHVDLVEWWAGQNPSTITLEQVADRLLKRIAATYPKADKVVVHDKLINIIAGNVTKCGIQMVDTKCIFEVQMVEHLKDYDDSFLC